jgi:hypothetical protein
VRLDHIHMLGRARQVGHYHRVVRARRQPLLACWLPDHVDLHKCMSTKQRASVGGAHAVRASAKRMTSSGRTTRGAGLGGTAARPNILGPRPSFSYSLCPPTPRAAGSVGGERRVGPPAATADHQHCARASAGLQPASERDCPSLQRATHDQGQLSLVDAHLSSPTPTHACELGRSGGSVAAAAWVRSSDREHVVGLADIVIHAEAQACGGRHA